MKNVIKSLAVMAAAVMVLGFGAHKAEASGVDFSVGLNFGIPVAAAPVYAPVPVYDPQPVRAYQVQRVRYTNDYGYRPVAYRSWHDYRYDRIRHDRGWHRGWDRDCRYR